MPGRNTQSVLAVLDLVRLKIVVGLRDIFTVVMRQTDTMPGKI